MPRRHPRRRLLSALITGGAALVVIAWLAGRVLSDRWGWSQWLLWTPTPIALIAAILGLLASWRRARRPSRRAGRARAAWAWTAVAAGLAVWTLAIEHRPLTAGPEEVPGRLRIAHWNVTHGDPGPRSDYAEALRGLDVDLVVLTNAGSLLADPEVGDWAQGHTWNLTMSPFTVVTDLGVHELRWLLATNDAIRLAQVTLLLDGAEGVAADPVVVWLVDLPSDPRRGRANLVRRIRRLLDAVEPDEPDLIIGDFNMTRGVALSRLAPRHRNAWDTAGRGWSATFPRQLPLLHIDHTLVGPRLDAADYRAVNPGVGTHRLQMIELSMRGPARRGAD